MADVSVVLCTRDGRRRGFLGDALNSVFSQSTPPSEVIVVDDGSTDGTGDWVRSHFPSATVIDGASRGLAAARNRGVDVARAQWIAFIDDDDLWLPDKLAAQAAQIDTAERPESTIWVALPETFDTLPGRSTVPVRPQPHSARWPACLLGNPVFASGAVISKDLAERVGPFDEDLRFGAAYQFWIRCIAAGSDVRYTDHVLVQLRRHQEQMSASDRLVDGLLDIDSMLRVFLGGLPSELALRVRTARMLTTWRAVLLSRGFRGAAEYWATTPLRPGQFDARVGAYFLLDSAARRGPRAWSQWLWGEGTRLLFKGPGQSLAP